MCPFLIISNLVTLKIRSWKNTQYMCMSILTVLKYEMPCAVRAGVAVVVVKARKKFSQVQSFKGVELILE